MPYSKRRESSMTAWKAKYTELSESVGKLKDMLGTGDYAIARCDKESMGIGEVIEVGNVLEEISNQLLPEHDYERREKES